ETTSADPAARAVPVDRIERPYDCLVLACGMTNTYFGRDESKAHSPGLKTVEDALEPRRRILLRFQSAVIEADDAARRAALHFVLIGGGPTGVEMAGAISEIARESIPRDFRRVDTRTARVVLVEALGRILPTFDEVSSRRAKADLERLGVEVLLGGRVTAVDDRGVTIGEGDDAQRIDAGCVVWSAGLKAEPVGATLGAPTDRAGRVQVGADLSVPGHPEVFVVGDQMAKNDPGSGKPVPGVAQGAMQSGRFVGRLIRAEVEALAAGRPAPPRPEFRYHDKGSMATIGRARAVAEIGRLRFGGFPA